MFPLLQEGVWVGGIKKQVNGFYSYLYVAHQVTIYYMIKPSDIYSDFQVLYRTRMNQGDMVTVSVI